MSQGFGQRNTNGPREGLRSVSGVKFERTTDDDDKVSSPQLRRLVIGIGVMAVLVAGYVASKSSDSGPGIGRFWKKNDTSGIAELYVPTTGVKDVALDQANKTCRTRGESSGGDMVRQSAVYVGCLAAESPKRLCQVAHRTHLLAAMRNYYRLQATNRADRIQTDPPIITTLKAVVANGFMPKRDIVAVAPSDVEAALKDVDPKKANCGGG